MVTLTGTFLHPDGSGIAGGILVLQLSGPGVVTGTGQVAPTLVSFTLDSNGNIPAASTVFGVDALSPAGLVYYASVYLPETGQAGAASGNRVWTSGQLGFTIAGASFNFNTAIPTSNTPTAGALAVLQNPSSTQTITSFPLILPNLDNILFVDGTTYTTVQAAINALPTGGGTVLIPPGTYVGPTSVPSGVALVGMGSPNIVAVAANIVAFTYSTSFVLQDVSATRFENIQFDFSSAGSPAGLVLKSVNAGCFGNRFIRCTWLQAGGSGVPAVKLWASSGVNGRNVGSNSFQDIQIYCNNISTGGNPGPAVGIQCLGTGTVGGGAIVTLNDFRNVLIRGGVQGGIDMELNSDTNYFYHVDVLQEWASTPANSYVLAFNLNTPASDQDANSCCFYGVSITGGFTSFVRAGQATGHIVDLESSSNFFGITVTGGTPQLSGRLFGLNGVSSFEYNQFGTQIASVGPGGISTTTLAAQSAAISTTNAVAPVRGGLTRVSFYAKIQTPATTSSTLGPVTIGWSDSVDNVACTAVSASSTGNLGSTNIVGDFVINVKAGTNITYAMGYASSGATAMTYQLIIKIEEF